MLIEIIESNDPCKDKRKWTFEERRYINYQYPRWKIFKFVDGGLWHGPMGYRKATMSPLGWWINQTFNDLLWWFHYRMPNL